MSTDEIVVPKEIREFMPDDAKETVLGLKNDSIRQYRYGNLHIREYSDKFLIHTDTIDPRVDPLGHLFLDAPEILTGLGCAVLGGIIKPNRSITSKIASSILFGSLAYAATKKLKSM